MVLVAVKPKPLSAAEMDLMTPDARAQAVGERVVTDLDELPPAFRSKVEETGRRLAAELETPPSA